MRVSSNDIKIDICTRLIGLIIKATSIINYLTTRITSLPKINGTSGKNQILFLLFFIVDLFHGKKNP